MKRGYTLIVVVITVMLVIIISGFTITIAYNNYDRASIEKTVIDLYSFNVEYEDSITRLNNYFREDKDSVRKLLSGEKIKIDGIYYNYDGNNIIGTVGEDIVGVYNVRIESVNNRIIIYPQEKGYGV